MAATVMLFYRGGVSKGRRRAQVRGKQSRKLTAVVPQKAGRSALAFTTSELKLQKLNDGMYTNNLILRGSLYRKQLCALVLL
jgi:hypothetical protein